MRQYFGAMSWLGRVEIQIAKRTEPRAAWRVNRRALGASLLLASLFDPGARELWQTIDTTPAAFVGAEDSLSLSELSAISTPEFELVTENFERLTDDQWRERIAKQMLGTPPWLAELTAP
jgi:hypothetical protein